MNPIPPKLLLVCIASGAVYLILINWALLWLERVFTKMGMWGEYPSDLLRPQGKFGSLSDLVFQISVFVVFPAMFYNFMYLLLPFEGIRTGLVVALLPTALGALPMAVMISARTKLPSSALAFFLLGHLIRIAGTLSIIGYLFSI